MGKFGRKNDVDLNPLHYNIALLGESGVGKTTISKEMCEKLVGEDGYIHFDIGREDGAAAIQGIVSEKIEDWAKLTEVVDDIVENKQTDYPNLRVILWDTLDELIVLAETESIRLHNRANPDKKTTTINSAWGGFGKGQDKAIELILDKIWELKKAGVSPIIIGHVKRSDITDPVTQETFSKLTSDTQQRYFNAIKNKMHFIGLAYIDRNIVKEKLGRKNVVTKEDITINKVVNESRVISFRDDTYSVDSKSRFADIVDRIPFDADEFIKAMKDAIEAERSKSGETLKQSQERQAKKDAKSAEEAKEYSANKKANHGGEDEIPDLIARIQPKFLGADKKDRDEVKKIMATYGITSFRDVEIEHLEGLRKIAEYLAA